MSCSTIQKKFGKITGVTTSLCSVQKLYIIVSLAKQAGLSPIYLDTSKTGADPKKFVQGIPGPLDFDF